MVCTYREHDLRLNQDENGEIVKLTIRILFPTFLLKIFPYLQINCSTLQARSALSSVYVQCTIYNIKLFKL